MLKIKVSVCLQIKCILKAFQEQCHGSRMSFSELFLISVSQ